MNKFFGAIFILLLVHSFAVAQPAVRRASQASDSADPATVSEGKPKFHSDNGNGTYTNPVIAADFPIRM